MNGEIRRQKAKDALRGGAFRPHADAEPGLAVTPPSSFEEEEVSSSTSPTPAPTIAPPVSPVLTQARVFPLANSSRRCTTARRVSSRSECSFVA